MPAIDRSAPAASVPHFRARHLMFAVVGTVLLGSANASSSVAAQAPYATYTAQTTEEIILRAPDVVRRPLPRSGPGAPTGLMNPEVFSLTRAVNYSDLDLSRPADIREMERRIGSTARDICQELARRLRQSGDYVSPANDCIRKATDDGIATLRTTTVVAKLKSRTPG